MLLWTFLGAAELLLVFAVLYTARTNEWMKSSSHFAIIVYYLIFYCFLANSSAAMTFKKKESAKKMPSELLRDLDVEYDSVGVKFECVRDLDCNLKERLRIWLGNFIQFCTYHFAYGLVAVFGSSFVIAAIIMFITYLFKKESSQDMLYSVLILVVFGAVLLTIFCQEFGNARIYFRRQGSYRPFDEKVKMPLKVFGAKVLAAYLTGGFMHTIQLPVGLYLFINGFRALYFIHEIPKESILQLHGRFSEGIIYATFRGIIVVVIFVGLILICQAARKSYVKAKKSLLVTMEQNWQRNLHALKYLIPMNVQDNAQDSSLDGLLARLESKKAMATPLECAIFGYLSLPLWKPKRGFCEKQIISRKVQRKRPFGERFELRGDPPAEAQNNEQ